MQMTYVGAPMVYYGDEVGMKGHTDPYCRAPFNWDPQSWDLNLKSWYQACITLRRQMPVLQTGAYLTLYAKGDVFVFCRFNEQHALIIAVNRSALTKEIPLTLSHLSRPASEKELLLGEGEWLGSQMQLPAFAACCWQVGR